jgi:hypothetical protein
MRSPEEILQAAQGYTREQLEAIAGNDISQPQNNENQEILEKAKGYTKEELERIANSGTSVSTSKKHRSIEGNSSEYLTPQDLAMGARSAVGGLGDLADLPILAANYGLSKAGSKKQIPYPGNAIANKIDELTGGYTAPKTYNQRIAESAIRAPASLVGGSGIGKALIKLPGMIGKIGRGISAINPVTPTSMAATSAGAAGSHAALENNPEDITSAIALGLAPDILLRSGRGLINKRVAAKATSLNPDIVENFKEIGISPTLGQASQSGPLKTIEKLLENTPIAGKKIRELRSQQNKTIGSVFGPAAEGLAQSELEAGKTIHKGFSVAKEKADQLTGELKHKVLEKVKTAPSDLIDIKDSLNFYKELEKNNKTAAMMKLLEDSPLGKEASRLKKMASHNNGKVPFGDVEGFRTHLFDEITKRELGSISRGRLEHFRSLLNQDIHPYMNSIGAGKEWNRYNKFYSNYATYHKSNLLQPKEVPILEAHKLFDNIGTSGKLDRPLLNTVYGSLGKTEQKNIMDSLIQKMGKDGNDWNAHRFAKRFESQPKETKDLFLKPLSQPMKERFKSVLKSIDAIKETNSFSNTSRTAYTQMAIDTAKIGIPAGAAILAGNSPTDTAWEMALVLAGSRAIASGMFANPKFINWAYKGSKLKTPKSQQHHIAGIKGILGRPVYQEIKSALSSQDRLADNPYEETR